MKKAYLLLSVSIFIASFCLGQDWVGMMQDNTVNVHDVKAAYDGWAARHGNDGVSEMPGKNETDGNAENFFRWYKIAVQHASPSGVRPNPGMVYNEYRNAIKARSTMRTMAAANWTYIGLPTYNNYMSGNGRVNRLAFYPGSDSVIFACTPTGGLWKSSDGGFSWTTNTDQLPGLAMSDMAIDPVHPNIMYLATGDADAYNGTTIGIMKSIDGGRTWDTTGLYYTIQSAGPNYYEACRVLVSPLRDSTIYAGTNLGVYYSLNAGLTWARGLSANVHDLQFEPSHPTTMYASTYDGKFYRSTNGGMTFNQVTTGLPAAGLAGRMAIGVSQADSNVVYVVAANPSTYAFYGLYLSSDRGQTFTTQSTSPNILGWTQYGTDNTGQGWYDLCITLSPTNTDSVYVAGPDMWVSADKGVTWTNLTYYQIHVDDHHIVFAPGSSSKMYLAEDGGVYASFNAGVNWFNISSDLQIGEEYAVGVSATSANYFMTGWQDNCANLCNFGSWSAQFGGDGEQCFVDYTNNNTLYAEAYLFGYGQSINGGATWDTINHGFGEPRNGYGPFFQDPQNSNYLFAGGKNVWEYNGYIWNQLSAWGGNYITAMAVAPSNDQVLYAGEYNASYDDVVYVTTNGGTTWQNITNGLPFTAAGVSGLVVDPVNPQRAWISFNGFANGDKVYQSTNGGITWKNISAGLPNLPINCIVYQPGSPDGIYVGTDVGVYYRDTVLGNWISFNNGLPNVMIDQLQIFAPNILMAATYGRGTWSTTTYLNLGVNELNVSEYIKVYPNPTSGKVTVSMDLPVDGDYVIKVTDLLGRNLSENKIHADKYEDNIDLENYGKGVYFVSITGPNCYVVKKVVVY